MCLTRSHAHTHGTVGSIETQNGPPRGPLTPFPGPSQLARPGNRRSGLRRLHQLHLFSNFRCVESSGAASASAFAQPPRRLRDSATALCATLRLRGVFHHKGASHPSARGHWACFCSFPITNVAAMDGRALVLRWAHGLSSLRYHPQEEFLGHEVGTWGPPLVCCCVPTSSLGRKRPLVCSTGQQLHYG